MTSSVDWTAAQKAELVSKILSGEETVHSACAKFRLTADLIRDWVLSYRQSAREAFDARISQTLTAQGIDARELGSTEFTASLVHISVADVLQTIWMGRKHALLVISEGAEMGRIWCADGEIVDAESRRLTGEHAVYRLLAIESGQLRADFQRVQRVRMVHASTQALLLEAARRKDESDRLRARLGGPSAGYGPAPSALWGQTFGAAELDVSRLFDDGSCIERALHESSHGELETLELILRLVERGQLEPRELSPGRSGTRLLEVSPASSPSSSQLAYVQSRPPPRPGRRWQGAGWAVVLTMFAGVVAWVLGRAPVPAPPVSFAVLPAPAASPASNAATEHAAPPAAEVAASEQPPSPPVSPKAALPPSPPRVAAAPARPAAEQPPASSAAQRSAPPSRSAPARSRELDIDVIGQRAIRVQVIE